MATKASSLRTLQGLITMTDFISGIQQVGIGVKDAPQSLRYYARLFGMTTLVFDDVSEASLMTRYTGGNAYRRQASLSLNMQGGGGFEVWQFQNRKPIEALPLPQYGDIGIYAAKLKCADVEATYSHYKNQPGLQLSSLQKDIKGDLNFWLKDELGNVFNIVKAGHWFHKNGSLMGGVCGAVIGVSDMEKALLFYQRLLGVDKKEHDVVTCSNNGFDQTKQRHRTVWLQKKCSGKGAFGKLLGDIELELVQCLDRKPATIFANRFWGDCGFIHLCFDVFDMCGLKKAATENGYPFTVDSIDSFGMEGSAGRFCYMEDPDGTLIELVETHKVPVIKKLGIYLNLKKRNLERPLPDWMIKLLALSKVK